jgi:kynurenine 3-monooxygenase
MGQSKITIVGAGLCGSLLALKLGQRGFEVEVYERRPDLRLLEQDAGRSINLALSDRGLNALASAGIKEIVHELCIPMHGRMIHAKGQEARMSNYSGRTGNYINSISRPGLNALLLDEADKFDNVNMHFNQKCLDVDVKGGKAKIYDSNNNTEFLTNGDIIIGTDGSGSIVRRSIMRFTNQILFNFSQKFLTHGYKELSILPGVNNAFKIEKNALHIWPRTSHMIIALPNLDGSFTVTMFHPYDGEVGFNSLDTDDKIKAMFETEYPELLPYMPNYLEDYHDNPTSNLSTIKCDPWQAFGKTLLMGDAAHAVVPFYGQGMNASLEDVFVFDQFLDEYGEEWEALFINYQKSRIPNTNAIADLALDNFYEMRDHVDDEAFIHKRALEMKLEENYPEYYSKYSMVTFNKDLGYNDAMIKGRNQDQLLLDICRKNPNPNMDVVMNAVRNLHS